MDMGIKGQGRGRFETVEINIFGLQDSMFLRSKSKVEWVERLLINEFQSFKEGKRMLSFEVISKHMTGILSYLCIA